MSTKTVRIDSEVLDEIKRNSEGRKSPNQALREVFGLPERKYIRSKLSGDHVSRAERYLLKALDELKRAREG